MFVLNAILKGCAKLQEIYHTCIGRC